MNHVQAREENVSIDLVNYTIYIIKNLYFMMLLLNECVQYIVNGDDIFFIGSLIFHFSVLC